MKLLHFAASSMVNATTGSHLTETSYRTAQLEDPQVQTRQTRTRILPIIRNNMAAVSQLVSRLVTANRQRLQQNKDTVRILQLNAHNLKDIGLTYDDIAELKSGQISLKGLSAIRSKSQGPFDLRLKKAGTSKVEVFNLKAANQELGEFASCG